MTTELATISLFPLRTVLFPGGPLLLRVFESRYLDMISNCMKEEEGFGVVLISDGTETGVVRTHRLGTLAKIADWYQYEDGVLGMTVVGERRFELIEARRQSDGLNVGNVRYVAHDPDVPLPERFAHLGQVLQRVMGQVGSQYDLIDRNHDDASWVSLRLAELLPLTDEQRQACLEMIDPISRLDYLEPIVESMRRV